MSLTNSLVIGRIPYMVCAPFFHGFTDSNDMIFIDGHPAEHNKKLRKGEVDTSPSSCIEYARAQDSYELLPMICTGGGPNGVGSVVLFSNCPLSELCFDEIEMTGASDTSVVLLKVLGRHHFNLRQTSSESSHTSNTATQIKAKLFIGDEALRERQKGNWAHTFDLGKEWFDWQGLPFVFGVWIVNKEAISQRFDSLKSFFNQLVKNVDSFKSDRHGSLKAWVRKFPSGYDSDSWDDYFNLLQYDFKEEQKESLLRFFGFAHEMGLCERVEELKFVENLD